MSGVPHARLIQTAAELILLLQEIKKALVQGCLEQIYPTALPFAMNCTLMNIPDEGPWPDYLEAHFRVPGVEQHYKLAVDIYHGAGGQWGPEKLLSDLLPA